MNTEPPPRLGIVGAGTMGVGIAAVAVGNGLPVVLVDVDEQRRAAAPTEVRQAVRLGQLLGGLPRGLASGKLTMAKSIEAVADCTAVVESVPESPELKLAVLAEISDVIRPGRLVATNTSAIPVDELAAALRAPEDFVGTHFMNPPYAVDTVEVIRGPRSGEQAVEQVRTLLSALGRKAIVVGDGPGFVINRILQRMINEAARVVAEGIAEPAVVDDLLRGCLGHRTGPLATADLIGLDNVVDTLTVLHERTGDPGYRPSDLLVEMVARGEHGRKSGRGFYEYGDEQP